MPTWRSHPQDTLLRFLGHPIVFTINALNRKEISTNALALALNYHNSTTTFGDSFS